jgi:hypothetical protein
MSEFHPEDQSKPEHLTPKNADVCHDITLGYIQDDGTSIPLDAQLLYSQNSPYSVEALFGEQKARWVFARDLLAEGLYEPTGIGDVRVWPTLSAEGHAAVTIELRLQDTGNNYFFQAPAKAVADFIDETDLYWIIGQEAFDIDAELKQSFPSQS